MLLGGQYTGMLVPYYGAFVVIVLGEDFMPWLILCIIRWLSCAGRERSLWSICWLRFWQQPIGNLVSGFGINGAAGCYLLLMVGLVLGFGLYTAGVYQKEKRSMLVMEEERTRISEHTYSPKVDVIIPTYKPEKSSPGF